MAAINNGDVVRAAVVWNVTGAQSVVNVYALKFPIVLSPVDYDDAKDIITGYLTAAYDDTDVTHSMSEACVHQRVELFNLTQGAPLLDIGPITALNGQGDTDPFPSGVSAMLVLQTAVSRKVGRKYLPPFTEDTASGNRLTDAQVTRLQGMVDFLKDDFIEFDELATVRYVVGTGAPATMSDCIGGYVQRILAYQRRRKPLIGS